MRGHTVITKTVLLSLTVERHAYMINKFFDKGNFRISIDRWRFIECSAVINNKFHFYIHIHLAQFPCERVQNASRKKEMIHKNLPSSMDEPLSVET